MLFVFFEKQQGVSLSQAAIPSYKLRLRFNGFQGGSGYAFTNNYTPQRKPSQYYSLGSGANEVGFTWNDKTGVPTNNPNETGTIESFAGDTIYIRMAQSSQDAFTYTTKEVRLEQKEQIIDVFL